MVHNSSHLRTIVNQHGAAVLDTKLGLMSTLNATGAYVWQGLERGESIEKIAANLSRETGAPRETVERDVCEFVDSLRAHQLLLLDEQKELQ